MCDSCKSNIKKVQNKNSIVFKTKFPELNNDFWKKLTNFVFIPKSFYFFSINPGSGVNLRINLFVNGENNGNLDIAVLIFEENSQFERKYIKLFKFSQNVGIKYVENMYKNLSNKQYNNIIPNLNTLIQKTKIEIINLFTNLKSVTNNIPTVVISPDGSSSCCKTCVGCCPYPNCCSFGSCHCGDCNC